MCYSPIVKIPDIDDCVTQPCKNSGTCKDGVNIYSCVCQTGFIGDHCETGELFLKKKNMKTYVSIDSITAEKG